MELTKYLEHWKELLTGSGPSEKLAQQIGAPLDRLRIYRRLVDDHYEEAITLNYRRTQLVEPKAFTKEHFQQYYRTYPPAAWEINQLAKDYPEYLRTTGLFPTYISELAAYEWTRFSLMRDLADDESLLAELPAGMLALHPALALFSFENEITDWLDAIDEAKTAKREIPLQPVAKPETIFVSRVTLPYRLKITQPSVPAIALVHVLSERKLPRVEAIEAAATLAQVSVADMQEEAEFLVQQGILLSKTGH